jgi:hypothetical protein
MKEQLALLPDQISGFSRVEYLSVFLSLLYAFAVAEFLLAWGKMLRNRQSFVFSTDQMLWSIVLFYALVVNWYRMWPMLEHIEKGFIYFAIVFLQVLIFYFVAIVLFPDLDKETDLKKHYDRTIHWIIALIALYLFTQILTTIVLMNMPVMFLFNITRGLFIVLAIVALCFPHKILYRILLGYIYLSMLFATLNL